MQLSPFLRTMLKLDAATCLVMGAALLSSAGMLRPILGIPEALLSSAGLSLIPIGLFILWLGLRHHAPAPLVYLVVLGNVGWTGGSFAALALLNGVSLLGAAAVVVQALAVALFAMLEWRGAKESLWSSAAA